MHPSYNQHTPFPIHARIWRAYIAVFQYNLSFVLRVSSIQNIMTSVYEKQDKLLLEQNLLSMYVLQ